MKKLSILLIIPVLLILGVSGAYYWWNLNSQPVNSGSKEVKSFLISKGEAASSIGKDLEKQGLIKNSLAFKFYIQFTDKQDKLQPGEFLLSPGKTLPEIVESLTKGPTEIWVTIPEGLRREEIALRFIKGLGLSGDSAEAFLKDFLQSSSGGIQGTLFPDTYLFPKDVSAAKVVGKMTDTFAKRIEGQLKNDIEKSDLGMVKILTLASLIERETKTDAERPVVAGIILKRLNAGWPLQIDASLQYGIASINCLKKPSYQNFLTCNWWPQLTKEDLDTSMAGNFNTYKLTGLPLSPIANPGLSSIKAAVYPESSQYWFYIHDPAGQIHYAKTAEEHAANVSKYLGK